MGYAAAIYWPPIRIAAALSAFAAAFAPLATAQPSPPLGVGPDVFVCLAGDRNPNSPLRDYLVYAAPGAWVYLDLRADFNGAGGCTYRLNAAERERFDERSLSCSHAPRTGHWTVQGADEYFLSEPDTTLVGSSSYQSVELKGTGQVTITFTVDDAVPTACDCAEDDDGIQLCATHDAGKHAGATDSCKVILWNVESAISQPQPRGYTGGIICSVAPALTPAPVNTATGQYPWNFTSYWGTMVDPEEEINRLQSTSSQWLGEMVLDKTCIEYYAKVVNPFSGGITTSPYLTAIVEAQRREDWITTPTFAGLLTNDWPEGDTLGWAFPMNSEPISITTWAYMTYLGKTYAGGFKPNFTKDKTSKSYTSHGTNTNADIRYWHRNTDIYIPIYSNPEGEEDFASHVKEVASGPNGGLWYNTDKSMYRADRGMLVNKWVMPGGPTPGRVPVLGGLGFAEVVMPPAENPEWGQPYPAPQNYYQLQGVHFPVGCPVELPGCAICACEEVSCGDFGHTRYQGLLNHEGYGTNGNGLGHQEYLETAVRKDRRSYDVLYRVEEVVCRTIESLMASDETLRTATSKLMSEYTFGLHSDLNSSFPDGHNFAHCDFVFTNSTYTWNILSVAANTN